MKVVNLVGKRFGLLVVITQAPSRNGQVRWHCRCDCGKCTTVSRANLGRCTNSCGCYRRVVASKRALKPIQHVITTQIWNYYRRNASLRKIPWDLSKEDFERLIFSPCHYCGNPAGTVTRTTYSARTLGTKREMSNNGIDRLDNSKGYDVHNCVTACRDCNLSKSDRKVDEFIEWARRLVAHQDAQKGGA